MSSGFSIRLDKKKQPVQLQALDISDKEMSIVSTEPVFGVSDQFRHKPDCTDAEDGYICLKFRI